MKLLTLVILASALYAQDPYHQLPSTTSDIHENYIGTPWTSNPDPSYDRPVERSEGTMHDYTPIEYDYNYELQPITTEE